MAAGAFGNPGPVRPFDYIARLAETKALDRVAAPLRDAAEKVLRSRKLRDALHGVWLGHPVHPMLVQAPIGAFLSAAVADAYPDQRRAADTLIRAGLVASVPASLAGVADYTKGHEEQQRVGVVHAAGNALGLLCYVASLRLRATGRRPAGVAAGLAGLACIGASGALGGHLAYHLAMGANHAQGVPHVGPSDWTDLAALDELEESTPVKRFAGDVAVVLVRTGGHVDVLADTCAHASAPLHQGTVFTEDGETCLECPWHGSVYRLSDGAVVHGPATMPQAGFDSRVVAGRVEAKVRTFPGVPSAG